jgi:hypothetical protein
MNLILKPDDDDDEPDSELLDGSNEEEDFKTSLERSASNATNLIGTAHAFISHNSPLY